MTTLSKSLVAVLLLVAPGLAGPPGVQAQQQGQQTQQQMRQMKQMQDHMQRMTQLIQRTQQMAQQMQQRMQQAQSLPNRLCVAAINWARNSGRVGDVHRAASGGPEVSY